jgi:hypothetical protein
MTISVSMGTSCNGYHGLVEKPAVDGLDVRVFEFLDDGSVVYRNFHDWFAHGERARTYGTSFKIDSFILG